MNDEPYLCDLTVSATAPGHWHQERINGAWCAIIKAAVSDFAKRPESDQRKIVKSADEWSADDCIVLAQTSARAWAKQRKTESGGVA